MLIRPAQKNEVKQLQILNDEVFVDNRKYNPDLDMNWAKSNKGKEYFTKLLNNPHACCFIAEDKRRRIGYIAAAAKNISYRKSKYIEIENMGVTPKYRSRGIGTMLIEKCCEWAKVKGFQKIYVNAYFQNIKGVSFYKKNKFLEIDVGLEKILK